MCVTASRGRGAGEGGRKKLACSGMYLYENRLMLIKTLREYLHKLGK